MERTEVMRQWLQNFMDHHGGGRVLVDRQDGIVGNCCLTYLGTQELSRQWTLTQNLQICKRSHFYLTRLCGQDEGYSWLEALENWVGQEQGPVMEQVLAQVHLSNGRRTDASLDGTCQYGANLYVEYTVSYYDDDSLGRDIFSLDQDDFYVDVVSLEREFELREAMPACTTLDGTYHRELHGTYYHYTLTVRCRESRAELERFWEKISQPVESILCSFPYGQGRLTQRMYVQSATQQLTQTLGENKWDAIKVRFRGLEPQVRA